MKAVRGGYPAAALAERSRSLVQRLSEIPGFPEARSVALFWPMLERGEIDLCELDGALRERAVKIYYPFMDALGGGRFRTGFRLTRSADELVERGSRFAEPPLDAEVAERGAIDFVLVPALAADARGHRLGYGAGYYDATLGDVCPPGRAVLVVYDFQLLAELPAEPHDVPCDFVVTDKRWFSPAPGETAG